MHRLRSIFRHIAMRFAYFSQNPRSLAPFVIQKLTCTCAIALVVIRGSHLRLPPAWRASAARYALATFDSIGLVLSELRLLLLGPRKQLFILPPASAIAVWSPTPAHEPPRYLRGTRSVLFQSSQAAVLLLGNR